jgi:membrane protein DedA with SNARE-associated domain/rhodanese-related sulfurtransferase
MIQDLVHLVAQYGLLVVFVNVLLEQIGLPVPAVPTLIVAGGLAAEGTLSAPAIFAAAFVASMIGDAAWFAGGRIYGKGVMKFLCRISISPDSCVSQTEEHFDRWGVALLVFSKFMPGLSTITPPLAGAARLGVMRFAFYNAIGVTLWAGVAIGAGWLLHSQIDTLLGHMQDMGTLAVLSVGTLLAAYIAFKWWERRRFYRMLRMARISVEELYERMDKADKPVIVDVRSSVARSLDPRASPGSLPADVRAIDRLVEQLPADRDIILYCTCPNEAGAVQVAKLLVDRGITRVRPLHGGLDAWVAAGYAVASAAAASSAVSAAASA